MNAKKKIVVAVSAIVLLVIAGVVAVVSVLAARNVTIKSSLNVTYTADKVKATVSASIDDGVNNYSLGSLTFDGTETTTSTPQTLEGGTSDGTFSYTFGNELYIAFSFDNNSDKDLMVELIGKPTENNFNNIAINAYHNIQEETNKSWRILAGENSHGDILVVYHVGDKDKDASLIGDFQWHLSLADPVS